MDWKLGLWTTLSWLISGGLIYATYKYGSDMASSQGANWKSWRSGLLALGIIFVMVLFGGGGAPEDDYGTYVSEEDLTLKEWSRILGIFLAFACAFNVGFLDGRVRRK